MPALVPMSRVRELAARGRTAMVVGPHAYDFTDFQDLHPGGKDYLLAQKGKVATAAFTSSHPLDIIAATLSKAQLAAMLLGAIDAATIEPSDYPAAATAPAAAAAAPAAAHHAGAGAAALPPGPKPTLDSCLNIYDFEAIACASLSEQALAYYSSGGDDEITLRENHSAFHRLWMRPRVMVNVKAIDMTTTLLGARCALPLFLSAVAMCKMGHPEGEAAWMSAAGREGVVYMVPTLSGCSFGEIMGARVTPAQPAWFQLYVNPDREKTRETVQRAEAAGCSALFITVDAPQLGNREKDRRVKITHAGAAVQGGVVAAKSEGTSKALTTFIDPSLSWEDLPWFRSITKMKIILKGVGTADDAVRALESGCDGVLLSNHGGACGGGGGSSSSARAPPLAPTRTSCTHAPHARTHAPPTAPSTRAQAASWTLRAAALRCCPRPWRRCARTRPTRRPLRCTWTAACGAARTFSRRWRWARGAWAWGAPRSTPCPPLAPTAWRACCRSSRASWR